MPGPTLVLASILVLRTIKMTIIMMVLTLLPGNATATAETMLTLVLGMGTAGVGTGGTKMMVLTLALALGTIMIVPGYLLGSLCYRLDHALHGRFL